MGSRHIAMILSACSAGLGLYAASLYSYLLFHSLAELFSIVVACGIFMIAWNSRQFSRNSYILFLGIAYLTVACVDTLHTLSYKGMGVFAGTDTNPATQLWIAARYIEALSFLVSLLFIEAKVRARWIFAGYGTVFVLLVLSIFFWDIFPACFVEGEGLTPFKKTSEYMICLILALSALLLYRKRRLFDQEFFRLIMASLAITIASEMLFTFYLHAYGFSNFMGHLLKIASFYLIYRAFIRVGLAKPYSLLFRSLKASEEAWKAGEKKYRALVETLREGIWAVDENACTTYVNPRMAEMLGYETGDLVGKTPFAFMEEQGVEPCRRVLEGRDERDRGPTDFEFIGKDGRRLHVHITANPLRDGQGRFLGAIAAVSDITDRKRAENDLKRELDVNAALAELYKTLVSPSSTMKEIAGMILDKAKSLTGSPLGCVSSVNPLTKAVSFQAKTGLSEEQCESLRAVFASIRDQSPNGIGAFINRLGGEDQGFPFLPGGPTGMQRLLCVPVGLGGETVGGVALAGKERDYHEKDLEAVQRIAVHYALAVQRLRFQEALSKSHDELGLRVRQRTTQLVKINDELVKEIAVRRQVEEALKNSEAELRHLSVQLLSAEERERKRIALDLHDGIGQTLSAIKFSTEGAMHRILAHQHEEALKHLQDMLVMTQKAVEEVRRILMDLRPSILDDLGILPTISWFCREFQRVYGRIRITKEIDVEERDVPDRLKIVIFRVLQEALNNVAKHSRSESVTLRLLKTESGIEMVIQDRGVGFVPAGCGPDSQTGGFGLAGMKERTELSGGKFEISSFRGQGTKVHALWPAGP